jgi:hypothetical protein
LSEQRALWTEGNNNNNKKNRIKGQNNKLKKNVCVFFTKGKPFRKYEQ